MRIKMKKNKRSSIFKIREESLKPLLAVVDVMLDKVGISAQHPITLSLGEIISKTNLVIDDVVEILRSFHNIRKIIEIKQLWLENAKLYPPDLLKAYEIPTKFWEGKLNFYRKELFLNLPYRLNEKDKVEVKILEEPFNKFYQEVKRRLPPIPKATKPELETRTKKYWITLRDRKIVINDKYLLRKLQFQRSSELFFEYLHNRANQTIHRKELPKNLLISQGDFHEITAKMGFTHELKKCFFPNVGKDAIEFKNPVYTSDLEEHMVNESKLKKQLAKLKKIKASQ